MTFLKTMVGKKIVMTVTGVAMLFFVAFHVTGNSTIYFGGINAYAERLRAFPLIVWTLRFLLLFAFLFHVYFGTLLTLENISAKPGMYAVKKRLRATFASENMIWTGLLTGAFLVYHLLHFTFQVTNPEIAARHNLDALGRPDIFRMVTLSFHNSIISSVYVFALAALALHLLHGIQSLFQTTGLNNDRTMPAVGKAGRVAAIVLFLGYIMIPITIFTGIVK